MAPPLLALALSATVALPAIAWQPLAPGLDRSILDPRPDTRDDGPLEVVRVDPRRVEIDVATVAERGGEPRTAAQWAAELARPGEALVLTNAGMFDTDHRTHTGYLAAHGRVLSKRWVKSYQSVLGFGGTDPARILELDVPADRAALERYPGRMQNLRLIAAPGTNKWSKNGRAWSEAALAQDRHGNLLLLFARAPHMMVDFNDRVLAQLGVVSAQHLEGGPEASLTIRAPTFTADRAGSFETGFFDDSNHVQWPLPNVLVFRSRTARP